MLKPRIKMVPAPRGSSEDRLAALAKSDSLPLWFSLFIAGLAIPAISATDARVAPGHDKEAKAIRQSYAA